MQPHFRFLGQHLGRVANGCQQQRGLLLHVPRNLWPLQYRQGQRNQIRPVGIDVPERKCRVGHCPLACLGGSGLEQFGEHVENDALLKVCRSLGHQLGCQRVSDGRKQFRRREEVQRIAQHLHQRWVHGPGSHQAPRCDLEVVAQNVSRAAPFNCLAQVGHASAHAQ